MKESRVDLTLVNLLYDYTKAEKIYSNVVEIIIRESPDVGLITLQCYVAK